MKIIRCKICGAILYDKPIVKEYYANRKVNICLICTSHGSLIKDTIKRKELKRMLKEAEK